MYEFFSQTFSNPYVCIAVLTLAPFLELRASIPYGILVAKEHCAVVVLTAVVVNILLGPVIYFLLGRLLHVALRLGLVKPGARRAMFGGLTEKTRAAMAHRQAGRAVAASQSEVEAEPESAPRRRRRRQAEEAPAPEEATE